MQLTINIGRGYVGLLSVFLSEDRYALHLLVKPQSWLWGFDECWQMGTDRRWGRFGCGPLFMIAYPHPKSMTDQSKEQA